MKFGQKPWRLGARIQEDVGRAAVFRVGDLEVDPGQRQVQRRDQALSLPGHSFDFLLALIHVAPNIATSDYLCQSVWGGRPVSPETITQRAKLLRDALGDDSQQPRYVAVVRGQGYRLVPPVMTAVRPVRQARWKTMLVALTAALVVVVMAIALWPMDRTADVPMGYEQASANMARHTAVGLNAAVEGLTSVLADYPDFVPAHVSLAEARLLQARYRMLDRQVALRLSRDAVERALKLDPRSAPAHVALANTLALSGDHEGAEQAFRHAIELDPLLASALLDYGFLLLADPVDHRPLEAIELWRRAARRDVESDVVRSHLAWTEFRSGRFHQAEAALRDIVSRNPELPIPHFVLAELLHSDGRQDEAIRHYRRTLELNTWFSPLAYQGLVEALLDLQLDQAAAEVLQQARSMPEDGGLSLYLESMLVLHGWQEATATPAYPDVMQIESLSVSRPSQATWLAAMSHRLQGQDIEAREVMESGEPRLLALPGGMPVDGYWRDLICPYAQLLVEQGEAARGTAIARWLLNRIADGPDFARLRHLDPIICLTAAGDVDEALSVLQGAAAEGVPSGWRMLAIRPELVSLQSHPEFQTVLETIAEQVDLQRQALEAEVIAIR